MPAIPATQEAEARELLLEPIRQTLEVAGGLDHATALQPGDKARLSLKKYIHN